ncbi:MAG: FecR domain-containing protein [Nitrospirae bacterium]|nr:FecR domain-containing protein [Nitrospirota bacterium]
MKKRLLIIAVTFAFSVAAVCAEAAEEIGRIVALKGRAYIERNKKELETRLSYGIFLIDTVGTREASRTKMLFADDSVLTIGEKTNVVIKEFVQGKDDRGRAIFNLLDGKMRAVVGKSYFEVHTPTVVTAARGTVIYYETGIMDGLKFTTVLAIEGEVSVRSIDPAVSGAVVLKPGMMVTVKERQALPPPVRAAREIVRASLLSKERPLLKPYLRAALAEKVRTLTLAPQIDQQPRVISPVAVGIWFPK